MERVQPPLGSLTGVYGTSPAFLQRAAVVAVLSFLFFMTTLLIFYVRQQFIYFVLSTAFLVVYIFTMIGWVMQKRNVVSIYENGIVYRKFAARWEDIKSVKADPKSGITLARHDGVSTTIAKSVSDLDQIALIIRDNLD
jgi:ABC-type bacteriocin/lantibiotic exporter with double-glycine peptidase domain